MCNKKTYMLINALQLAKGKQATELASWICNTDAKREEKVSAVTRIYNELGIPELAKQRINEYTQQALEHLDAVSISNERKTELRSLALQMLNRQS